MNADPGYQFIDTNILVYAHDSSAGVKHIRAKEIIRGLWENRFGCLSIQVLQEFYVTVTQKVTIPMELSLAMDIISDMSHWNIHAPCAGDVLAAIDLQQRYCISFWDAMITQSAVQMRCGVIWSQDLQSGQMYHGVRVVNPFSKG
ncbi:MAG: PIN domain-containing protein [Anaerolineaceae bacterium]|nr:PIN domain-containing protein [Anaerolineaceae bacterium]